MQKSRRVERDGSGDDHINATTGKISDAAGRSRVELSGGRFRVAANRYYEKAASGKGGLCYARVTRPSQRGED